MSHFLVTVLIDSDTDPAAREEAVGDLLAPYDEHLDGPEREEDCYCVSHKATLEGREQANRELTATNDRIEEMRKEFAELKSELVELVHGEVSEMDLAFVEGSVVDVVREAVGDRDGFAELREREQKMDREWKRRWQEIKQTTKRYIEAHPDFGKPDPDCGECGGSGRVMTTYNEKSKWDWWVIGGRWQGTFDPDYDPAQDPRNYSDCDLCSKSGKRYWIDNSAAVAAGSTSAGSLIPQHKPASKDTPGAVERVCNGCQGTGQKLNFILADHEAGNVVPARYLLELIEEGKGDPPYALVTPDGEWHQRGEMGWFGTSSNEIPRDRWRREAKRLLRKHKDSTAIAVDCHI